MRTRLLLLGFALWLAGTLVIRGAGHTFLDVRREALTAALYASSFVAMAVLVRAICNVAHIAPPQRPVAALLLVLPTLVLDPFSTLFAATLFPNLTVHGVIAFGGLMLICCAGALAAAFPRMA